MFSALTQKFSSVFDRLCQQKHLSEKDVDAALRDIRIALLEADVALSVVKDFIATIQEKAVGEDVIRSVSPGQMVVKIVNDHLIDLLGGKDQPAFMLTGSTPRAVMMVGLQGSGKTTSSAKLGLQLTQSHNAKVLLVSLDIYRPAAQEQLRVLAEQAGLDALPIVSMEKPESIAKRALAYAKDHRHDVIIFDTAGRLHIDDDLMQELVAIRQITKPEATLLVADAMTGQDAVTIADQFHQQVGLTGVVLTRIDGDTRGGAALSIRHVTGCPILFMGVGEKLEALEPFYPERIASRILDMGDIVSLVEKASSMVEQEEAEKMAARMMKGQLDLNDMLKQLQSVKKMGGLAQVVNFLPGAGKIKDQLGKAKMDEGKFKKQEAIILSMTPKERAQPHLLKASRIKRIAAGSGSSLSDVQKLLKQFEKMQNTMKRFGKMKDRGQLPPEFDQMFSS